jgi:hypothetical protein
MNGERCPSLIVFISHMPAIGTKSFAHIVTVMNAQKNLNPFYTHPNTVGFLLIITDAEKDLSKRGLLFRGHVFWTIIQPPPQMRGNARTLSERQRQVQRIPPRNERDYNVRVYRAGFVFMCIIPRACSYFSRSASASRDQA